jgi:hypothetical protein
VILYVLNWWFICCLNYEKCCFDNFLVVQHRIFIWRIPDFSFLSHMNNYSGVSLYSIRIQSQFLIVQALKLLVISKLLVTSCYPHLFKFWSLTGTHEKIYKGDQFLIWDFKNFERLYDHITIQSHFSFIFRIFYILRNLQKENKYSLSLPSPLLKNFPLKPFTLFLGGLEGVEMGGF